MIHPLSGLKLAVMLCVLGLAGSTLASNAAPPLPAGAGPVAVVRQFLKFIPGQQVDELRSLLAETKTCHITQESDPNHSGVWVETWDEWLKWIPSTEQSTHVVESIFASAISDSLAAVTLVGHTAGEKRTDLRAIIVLTRKTGGCWLIVSWSQENTPHPTKPAPTPELDPYQTSN